MATKTIPCPNCGEPALIGEANPWRPFCSERCKLIDLGDWLSEENRIPDDKAAPDAGAPWSDPDGSDTTH